MRGIWLIVLLLNPGSIRFPAAIPIFFSIANHFCTTDSSVEAHAARANFHTISPLSLPDMHRLSRLLFLRYRESGGAFHDATKYR